MSRIHDTFSRLKSNQRAAFMPFFCAGDPDIDVTARVLTAAQNAGADIVEIGVPFSDPVADGPTIQAAYYRALNNGFKVADAFELMRTLRTDSGFSIPAVMMISITLIERIGRKRFMARAKEAGYDGLIVPDCPVDRWDDLSDIASEAGLDMIALVAPNTKPARRKLVAERATGFIYQMAVTGITGARDALPDDLADCLTAMKNLTDTPIVVGFGISTPQHIRTVRTLADGAIIGSALVKLIAATLNDNPDRDHLVNVVSDYIRDMAHAAHDD